MTSGSKMDSYEKKPITRCIYCGKSKDEGIKLNVSDIFPASLTSEKLKNNNVCSIEHNNKFGETFESDVINSLSIIRNYLNIKNYSKKYPAYDTNLIVKGVPYKKKITNQKDILDDKILVSNDKKSFFGPIEKLREMKDFKEENLRPVDVNFEDMNMNDSTRVNTYLTRSMKRMIAKIAYEWHCKLEGINDRYGKYNSIINYIVQEQLDDQSDIVQLITELSFYNILRIYLPIGNHLLLRINKNNKTFVYVCLFGIAIYEVKILDNQSDDNFTFELQELYQAKNMKYFKEPFSHNKYNARINIRDTFSLYLHPSQIKQNEASTLNFLHENTKYLLLQQSVTKSSLQRFVKNYELNNIEELLLNYHNSIGDHFWIFLRIIYYLGEYESDSEFYDIQTISEFILEKIASKEQSLIGFQEILQKDKNNSLKINRGAEIVLKIID